MNGELMKKIILLAFLISIIVVGILYSNSTKFNLYDGKYLKPYLFSFGVDEDKKYIDPLGVSVSYFYYSKKPYFN